MFHVRGKRGIVYCWGPRIYNPDGVAIPPEILAHEGVHYSRQTKEEGAIRRWWERYLEDPAFRLAEELPAHRAEYKALLNRDRNPRHRSQYLQHVAAKLAAPLYGGIITPREAARQIMGARA